jgi:REP element-mobilizing transposase RayT
MIAGVVSHIVFTVKNSRYDWQRIKRKKSVGFIAPTLPFFEKEEEESLIKIICEVALKLDLKIKAFNFCGDHVHVVLITDNSDISKIIGIWKGKSAFLYHHQFEIYNEISQSSTQKNDIQNLWAKSFYQKIITSSKEYENAIYYVNNNRKKHGLEPLSSIATKIITSLEKKE